MVKYFAYGSFSALLSISSLSAAEYVWPTPYSEAHCRWQGVDNQTLHMYEGLRSPGFEVNSAQDCGLGIGALMLITNGRYVSYSTFNGTLEFKSPDGSVTKCNTVTIQKPILDNDDELLNYSGASRGGSATIHQLRKLKAHINQFIKVECFSDFTS